MRAALNAVAEEHKKKVRALKTQLKSERQGLFLFLFFVFLCLFLFVFQYFQTAWQTEQAELLDQISKLEKTRDDLRELVREQRLQLENVVAHLKGEADSDSAKRPEHPLPSAMPQKQQQSPSKKSKNAPSEKMLTAKPANVSREEDEWIVVQFGDTKRGATAPAHAGKHAFKQVVRGKREREALPEATDCAQCRAYFDALASEVPNVSRKDLVQQCTRHKSLFPEVGTPPGYWDVGFE